MNSTYTSDIILEVSNLSLSFKLEYFKHDGVRDHFVNFLKNPIEKIFQKSDRFKVLDQISLTIRKGERVGIIGVNGAGKTTLCRCINEMIYPDNGTIIINGTKRAIFNSAIGILPELTGRENAQLLATILYPELTSSELDDVIAESIEFSELGHFIDTPFKNYSKGMQTRLCLSIISARSCDLLILDEVYDGADEFFRRKIVSRIHDLISSAGAVILVSHNPDQIISTCNRLVILNNAKIIFDGDVIQGMDVYRGQLVDRGNYL